MRYRYNPYCSCARCRAHGYMGPAVLITLGVLFLLSQLASNYWLRFESTWPALLIVIGLVLFLQHSAPANGHIPREYAPPVYPAAPAPPAPAPAVAPPPVVPPPPPAPAAQLQPPPYNNLDRPEDREVHNG